MFRKYNKSHKSMLGEAIERANKIASEFDNITKQIVSANQYDYAKELNTMANAENNKLLQQFASEHPFEQTSEEQDQLRRKYMQNAGDIPFKLMTHSRDIAFIQFMNLHQSLCMNLGLAQTKLMQLMELQGEARNRAVVFRRGNFVKNITALTEEEVIKAFEQIKRSMTSLLEAAEQTHSILNLAFLFDPVSAHHDPATREAATQMSFRNRAAFYEINEQFYALKILAERMPDIELMKSFSEYLANHPHERLLSIELLKKVNPICDQIVDIHNKATARITEAIHMIEKAQHDDLKCFMAMKSKSVADFDVVAEFKEKGLRHILEQKPVAHQLLRLARRDKDLRIAIAHELTNAIEAGQPDLLHNIMNDHDLSREFKKLTINKQIKSIVNNYDEVLVNPSSHKLLK